MSLKVGWISQKKGAVVHAKHPRKRQTLCGRKIHPVDELNFTDASMGEDFEVDCEICWNILEKVIPVWHGENPICPTCEWNTKRIKLFTYKCTRCGTEFKIDDLGKLPPIEEMYDNNMLPGLDT